MRRNERLFAYVVLELRRAPLKFLESLIYELKSYGSAEDVTTTQRAAESIMLTEVFAATNL